MDVGARVREIESASDGASLRRGWSKVQTVGLGDGPRPVH